jgi:hypothetical protein
MVRFTFDFDQAGSFKTGNSLQSKAPPVGSGNPKVWQPTPHKPLDGGL